MTDASITIYHNPDCGTSRSVLALIRAAGHEPLVVAYLEVGWTRPLLESLLRAMQARPREILRAAGTPAGELGLLRGDVTDDEILDAMVAHPILVNRPIVVTPRGVALARPSESVMRLLEAPADGGAGEHGDAEP